MSTITFFLKIRFINLLGMYSITFFIITNIKQRSMKAI